MTWKRLIQWGLRELGNDKKFSLFYLLNMVVGLFGLFLLHSFQNSLEQTTSLKSREILSADFSLSARRTLSEKEVNNFMTLLERHLIRQKNIFKSRKISLYTMLNKVGSPNSLLVQLRGIEENYPFYGRISFQGATNTDDHSLRKDLQNPLKKGLWIFSELASQLQLKEGDEVLIGNQKFSVQKIVSEDSSDLSFGFSLAPQIYLSLQNLLQTGLVTGKSTLYDYRYFHFLPSTTPRDLEKLRENLEEKIQDNSLVLNDPLQAASQISGVFGKVNDYLSLVALVAAFLSAIGASYLTQNYIDKKKRNVAILKTLGMTPLKIAWFYLSQLSFLGLCSAGFSLLLAMGLFPSLSQLSQTYFNYPVTIHLQPMTLFLGITLGLAGGFLIGIPSLIHLLSIPTHQLLKGDLNQLNFSLLQRLTYLPSLIFFLGLSIFFAHSIFIGSLFFFSLMASFLVLLLLGWGFIHNLLHIFPKRLLPKRMQHHYLLPLTLKGMSRRSSTLAVTIVALGLSIILLNLIPILEMSIKEEMTQPEGSPIPALFLFDLQEEQIPEISKVLQAHHVQLTGLSPLVQARILKLNGKDFQRILIKEKFKTREDERQRWARNRGYNLTYTYSPSLSLLEVKDQNILKGEPFSQKEDLSHGTNVMEVSLEHRFADRLDLSIGDEILFDIQGIEISGKVVNLRKVRWTTFRPNFFIEVREKDLQEAPKTFLAVIEKLEEKKRVEIQHLLSQKFPGIAIIDVHRNISKVLQLLETLSQLLRGMSILSLFVGLIILATIANFEARKQMREITLLKVLGVSPFHLNLMNIFRFTLLAGISCFWGVLLCLLVSYLFSWQLFDGSWRVSWPHLIFSSLAIIFMSCGVALISVRRVFQVPSREIL